MIKLKDEFTPKRLDELAYGRTGATLREINMMGRLLLQATPAEHSDDFHFDLFAACCKEKLATARNKGRSGWDNPETCSVEHLAELLVHHLTKGNVGTFEDIANFAMMLHQRSADPKVLARAVRSLRFTPGEKDAVERALNVQPSKAVKGDQVPVEEADYTRYSCGCCGFESLHHTTKCPKCNYHKIESEPLFTAQQKPVVLPMQPTRAMIEAAQNELRQFCEPDSREWDETGDEIVFVWQAMVTAIAGGIVKDGE